MNLYLFSMFQHVFQRWDVFGDFCHCRIMPEVYVSRLSVALFGYDCYA